MKTKFNLKQKIKASLFTLTFAFATTAQANTPQNCWDYAAKAHGVDAWLLFAISSVESTFTPNIKVRNTNGTHDLGLMQINTIHIPTFKKLGISEYELQHNDCKNIWAAGYVLKQSIKHFGMNVDGVGGYHSYTPHLRVKYGKKVLKRYNELVQRYHINKEPFSFESYKGKKRKPQSNPQQYISQNIQPVKIVQNNHVNQTQTQAKAVKVSATSTQRPKMASIVASN